MWAEETPLPILDVSAKCARTCTFLGMCVHIYIYIYTDYFDINKMRYGSIRCLVDQLYFVSSSPGEVASLKLVDLAGSERQQALARQQWG